MTIVLVFGTRPDAIKLGPVVAELKALNADVRVIASGQHTGLLRGTPAESDLAKAVSLGLPSDGNVMRWVNKANRAFASAFGADDIVVVQGDTMTAYAAALAASAKGCVLAHVEAGVRSHSLDEPFPEERFRVQVDALADWHYAPTSTAYANLVAEGHALTRIRVTGNTVVSALARYANATPQPSQGHIVVTLHRREWADGAHFVEVLDALKEGALAHAPMRVLWPIHPTIAKRLGRPWFDDLPPSLVVTPPLVYREAARLLASAKGILTDSGGLVEEAAVLGVPSVQLRNVSDRPEAIEAGVSQLQAPTRQGVLAGLEALARSAMPRRPITAYGDATAASQVAQHLMHLDSLQLHEVS